MNVYSPPHTSVTSASSNSSGNSTDVIFSPSSSPIMCVNISVIQDGAVVILDSGNDEGVVLLSPNATAFISDNDCKSNIFLILKVIATNIFDIPLEHSDGTSSTIFAVYVSMCLLKVRPRFVDSVGFMPMSCSLGAVPIGYTCSMDINKASYGNLRLKTSSFAKHMGK